MTQRSHAPLLVLLAACTAFSAQAQGLRPSFQLSPAVPAAQAGVRQADYIVAVVNSEPITNNELRSRMVRVEQRLAQQGAPMPPRQELVRQVLDQLINERAQVQLARDTGIKVDEVTVNLAEQDVARQNQISVEQLHQRLSADGISLAQFRDELRNQVLLGRLREREVNPRVRVTDLDVDQYIREQQDSTDISNMEINLAQLLIAVPEDANAQQVAALQAKARGVLARARAGEDFTKLVLELSDSPERSNGGQVGLRNAERYPPLFIEATRNLRVGEVSEVVRSGAGFHVLKVLEKQQGGLPGVNVTQNNVRHILLRTGPQLSESAARERIAALKRRIDAREANFAELARQNSQDGSAQAGGDLGWTNPGVFVPEFEEAINALSPGQVSEPVVTRFGVHLIELLGRREATLSQREQRDIARSLVREKKLDEAFATWVQEVRGRAYVELREPPQ
ncbi:MAG: peptidylprolyl isomerase [Burkholderiaceae bacterium]|nr:peptidylprolyl isomerase [Burkholderiaceae bacterium]